MIVFLIFSILLVDSGFLAAEQDECQPARCHRSGPIVRFPFRIKGRQPEHCGYPGFDISCNANDITELEFQFPVHASARNIILPVYAKATVDEIDYRAQMIRFTSLDIVSCFPTRVPEVNASASPFNLYYRYTWLGKNYTLFNCSREPGNMDPPSPRLISCLEQGAFRVYAYLSSSLVSLPYCVKMYDISDHPDMINWPSLYYFDHTPMHWSEPFCGSCEASGMFCRLSSISSANNETECFEPQQKKKDVLKIAVVVVSVFVMAVGLAAVYKIHNIKKSKCENRRMIKQVVDDYNALRPTRFTYAEIKKITNSFSHRLGQGGYGTVFKGKLSTDILVAVKVLKNVKGNGEEFINEVGTIGKIHHVNVVRLVGYCADGYRRALVYEFMENDSLEKYISLGNQSRALGWEKLHKIAVGIAKGIEYLHQGCNQRILHFDIKPHNILLDDNLNPKVADFGLAKLCSNEQSAVTITAIRGTIGYIAPEVFSRNFGNVSYKSDIYSFGILLLNIASRRKIFNGGEQEKTEVYFPEWMYNQLDKGEDIAIQIEKEDEIDIVKRLIIVGLWGIQWYPVDRPSMKRVIQMLEGENMPIMPPNPFAASEALDMNATLSGSLLCSSQISI